MPWEHLELRKLGCFPWSVFLHPPSADWYFFLYPMLSWWQRWRKPWQTDWFAFCYDVYPIVVKFWAATEHVSESDVVCATPSLCVFFIGVALMCSGSKVCLLFVCIRFPTFFLFFFWIELPCKVVRISLVVMILAGILESFQSSVEVVKVYSSFKWSFNAFCVPSSRSWLYLPKDCEAWFRELNNPSHCRPPL